MAPEYLADAMKTWGDQHRTHKHYIQSGKSNQNAFIERFSKSFRTEVLYAWVFTSLDEVREQWRQDYTERSHDSLALVLPFTFLPGPTTTTDLRDSKLCA